MSKYKLLTAIFAIFLLLVGCSDSEEVEKTDAPETAPKTSEYTADNAFQWLKDSGLVSSEAEDITADFEGSEGLVKALRTNEADIIEFEEDSDAARYHSPDLNSYSVKNINILIKKGKDNAENFVTVLQNGSPSDNLETVYSSEAQKSFVESAKGRADFVPYVDGYYNLPSEERSSTFDSYIIDKEVTWSGTIADLEAMGDSIVIYGKDDYNGEDWLTISTDKKEMMPYTFIVELKDESVKADLKNGDPIAIKGVIGSRGDKEMQYNWKLYEGEVMK